MIEVKVDRSTLKLYKKERIKLPKVAIANDINVLRSILIKVAQEHK